MSGVLSRLSEVRVLRSLAVAILPTRIRTALWAASHDHFTNLSERFYAELYMNHLLKAINSDLPDRKLRVLDLGCGHGRFSIPLAKLGHDVVALDKNAVALGRARKYAAQLGVKIDFRNLDYWSEQLGKFDLVAAIETVEGGLDEVSKLVELTNRCLRVGGLVAVSVRTRYYMMANSLRRGDYQRALAIASDTGNTKWLEPSELQNLLRENGYSSIRIVGIGTCSGLRIDPLAALSVPDNLTSAQRESLKQIEAQFGSLEEVFGCGRWIFAVARKEKDTGEAFAKS